MRKEIGKLTAMLLTVCVCSQPCILPVWAAEGDGGHPETEAVSETVSETVSKTVSETVSEAGDAGNTGVLLSGEAARKAAEEEAERSGGPGAAAGEKAGAGTEAARSAGKKGESLGMFTVTGYCGCENCSGGHNLTYSGTVPKADHTLSADIEQFPIGTKLMIDGIIYTVEDMGSSIRGSWVDIYYDEHADAEAYGMQTKEVFAVIEQEAE